MNNDNLFRRIAAISAVIAALLILAATIVLALAVDFNFDFLANPEDLITAGLDVEAAGLFRVDPLARLELFYFFEPFWAIWLGIVILRNTAFPGLTWKGADHDKQ